MKLVIATIAAAFAIWAIIDALRSHLTTNQRILWIFIVIVFPIIGPLLYYVKGRK